MSRQAARTAPSAPGAPRRGRWVARRALSAALAWIVMIGGAVTAGEAMAQSDPRARAPAPGPLPRAQGTRRAEIKKKLMAFRAYRVTEELQLDEAGATRVFPLLSKYDLQIEQLTLERLGLHKALRQGPTDPRAIDELIRRTLANRRAFLDLEEKRLGELRKVLSPSQTARLLVVLPEIEQQIKAQIRRSVRRQQASDPLSEGGPDTPGTLRKRNRNKLPPDELDELE
jgi:hypothetical protein